MAGLGYSQGDIDKYIQEVEVAIEEEDKLLEEAELRAKQASITHPTKADLKSFFQRGIIDEATFRSELVAQGFESYWIDRYIQSAQAPTTE